MSKTVVTRPDLSEFENIRLHNIANMYVNICEDESKPRAIAYLTAQIKEFTYEDVKPYIQGVLVERGYERDEC